LITQIPTIVPILEITKEVSYLCKDKMEDFDDKIEEVLFEAPKIQRYTAKELETMRIPSTPLGVNLASLRESLLVGHFKHLDNVLSSRSKRHSHLVVYKLVVMGAILSFMLKSLNSPFDIVNLIKNSQYIIWTVPLVGIIFDMIIMGNLRKIAVITDYVKEKYENILFYEKKSH